MEARADSWPERIFLLVLFSLIAVLILTPLTSNVMVPRKLDFENHLFAIAQAKIALAEGQFPLRIAQCYGWRYPLFQFYAPTTYTLAGLIYRWLTPANPFIAEKIMIGFFLVIGGIYFYRLAYELVQSAPAAILAAVAYMTMPDYLIVIHFNGGLTEAVGRGIFPAVMYYTLQRYANPADTKTLLKTSLAWYLLITIHVVTAAIASFFVALLLFLMTCQNRKWISLIDVGVAYLFGCFLAMWYLMPIAILHDSFLVNRSFDSKLFYDMYKVSVSDLFSVIGGVTLKTVQTFRGPNISIMLHPNLGLPVVFAAGACFFLLLKKLFGREVFFGNKKFDYWLPALLFLFFLVFLFIWSPINFWQYLPPIFYIFQHPGRLLGQSMWIGALLLAGAISWIFKDKLDVRHTVCGVLILVALAVASFQPEREGYTDFTKAIKNPLQMSNNDYLIDPGDKYTNIPVYFDKADAREKNPQPDFSAMYHVNPMAMFSVDQMRQHCQQQKTTTICKLNVPEKIKLIELPVLAYQDMLDINVNGRAVTYKSMLYNGLFVAAIKPESGTLNTITVQFNGMKSANLLSEASWGIWFLYLCIIVAKEFLARPRQFKKT